MKYTLYLNARNTEIGIPYASSNSLEFLKKLSIFRNSYGAYIENNATNGIVEMNIGMKNKIINEN